MKKSFWKSLVDFPLRRGGFPPFPLRFFLAKWFSVQGVGGGGYPLNGQNPLKRFWQLPLLYVWYHKQFKNINIFWLSAYSQTLNWCQVCLAWVKSYTELWFLAVMSINNVDWLIIMKIFKFKSTNKKRIIFRQCVPQCGMVPLVSRLYPARDLGGTHEGDSFVPLGTLEGPLLGGSFVP